MVYFTVEEADVITLVLLRVEDIYKAEYSSSGDTITVFYKDHDGSPKELRISSPSSMTALSMMIDDDYKKARVNPGEPMASVVKSFLGEFFNRGMAPDYLQRGLGAEAVQRVNSILGKVQDMLASPNKLRGIPGGVLHRILSKFVDPGEDQKGPA